MSGESVKYQYFAAFAVNLFTIAFGVSEGWASASIILLMSDETPLASGKISKEQASWITSYLYLGGIFGNVVFGFITNKWGRKVPLILMTIPTIISWILILFAENVHSLYAARLLIGFIGSGIFVIVPLFLTESASDRCRGTLASTLILAENVGICLAFVLGNFCDFYTTPKVAIALIVLCAIPLFFLPEPAPFLVKKNKILEAEKSIRFYMNLSGKDNDYAILTSEIQKLRSNLGDRNMVSSLTWSDLTSRISRKAILIGVVVACSNQLSGCFAMLSYTGYVFQEAGSSMFANSSAIVVGVICIVGSYMSTYLVDRAGRKVLFTVSAIGTSSGLVVFGSYVMLKSWKFEVETFNWVPLITFCYIIFISSVGISNLPYVVISEIMPAKLKDFGVSLCMIVMWSMTFIMVKTLPFLTDFLGFYAFFFFAAMCLLGMLFIIFYVPETKGKSHEQIMGSLDRI